MKKMNKLKKRKIKLLIKKNKQNYGKCKRKNRKGFLPFQQRRI